MTCKLKKKNMANSVQNESSSTAYDIEISVLKQRGSRPKNLP